MRDGGPHVAVQEFVHMQQETFRITTFFPIACKEGVGDFVSYTAPNSKTQLTSNCLWKKLMNTARERFETEMFYINKGVN